MWDVKSDSCDCLGPNRVAGSSSILVTLCVVWGEILSRDPRQGYASTGDLCADAARLKSAYGLWRGGPEGRQREPTYTDMAAREGCATQPLQEAHRRWKPQPPPDYHPASVTERKAASERGAPISEGQYQGDATRPEHCNFGESPSAKM